MRKSDDGEKKKQEKKTGEKKKTMMKIVATNVVASRPPERRPTATPTARANLFSEYMGQSSKGMYIHLVITCVGRGVREMMTL